MPNTFKLKLIAPDGVKYKSDATAVKLPTPDGEIEILPNHMPLVSLLSAGEIAIINDDNIKLMATEGGVVEIANNLVKILADTAAEADDLDEMKILEAKKAAEERLANAKDEVEFTEAAAQLEKQIMMAKISSRRKRKY